MKNKLRDPQKFQEYFARKNVKKTAILAFEAGDKATLITEKLIKRSQHVEYVVIVQMQSFANFM